MRAPASCPSGSGPSDGRLLDRAGRCTGSMDKESSLSALQGTEGAQGAVLRVSLKNNRCAAGQALAGLRRRESR